MFAAVAATLGLASCNETWDDAAQLKTHEGTPTVDILNQPILQDQVLMITQENKDGSILLTCSQPDYGYAAIATYKVQVSLDGKFDDPEKYIEIRQDFYNCAQINPTNNDIAAAVEKLSNVRTEDDLPLPYQKVYLRLRVFVSQSEANTTYYSNVVSYNQISADYLAIWVADIPKDLYLRGGFNDWGTGEQWQFVTGEEEDTWICRNVTIAANVSIKVSTSSWGFPNLGGNAGENDASQMITANEPYVMTLGANPGHMRLDKDFHGDVILSLVDGEYTILFSETAPAE